jgi:hypothetical protein
MQSDAHTLFHNRENICLPTRMRWIAKALNAELLAANNISRVSLCMLVFIRQNFVQHCMVCSIRDLCMLVLMASIVTARVVMHVFLSS